MNKECVNRIIGIKGLSMKRVCSSNKYDRKKIGELRDYSIELNERLREAKPLD